MRILLLIHDTSVVGGMEIQLVTLANGLVRAGHAVRLVSIRSDAATAPSGADLALDPRVELMHLGAHTRGQRAAALPRLRRLAKAADVVHCTGWDTSLWGRLAAIAARRPAVVAEHAGSREHQRSSTGASRAQWIAAHNRLLDPFTHATVICAERQRPLLLAEGVDPHKIDLIPNGVPVADMRRQAGLGVTRESLGIPADAKVVVQVASFRAMKRQALAVETIARLRRSTGEDLRLVFAGTGPEFERVREMAAGMDADWAIFLGAQRNTAAVFALADASVLPSSSEALPMVIVESIAMGVPVVATDVGDVRMILERTGAGLLVPADDSDALADALGRVLTEPQTHAALTRAAQAARTEVDADTMVARYEELLHRAARRSHAPRPSVTTTGPTHRPALR